MSFLSNFNILVEIQLGPTDLLKSNEDMTSSISVLSVGLTKKEILDLFLRKSEKCLCENEILSFVLVAIEEKWLLKISEIPIGLEIVGPSTVRVLGISAEMFLIFRIDFKPFNWASYGVILLKSCS